MSETVSLADMMRASLPTEEQMEGMRQRRAADRALFDSKDGFCPVDLGDWIDLAKRAGVPYVPSEVVASVPVVAITWLDENGPDDAAVAAFYDNLSAAVTGKDGTHIVRWSCCSMADLKYSINGGSREWQPSFLQLYADDFRAFDILSEVPRTNVHAHLRPYIELATRTSEAGTFGLEVRVFVSDNRVSGVSAYYPQCPMDEHDREATFLISEAARYAYRLIAAQTKPIILPQVQDVHLTTQNAWTADFVMSADGEVLFLEGGPPHCANWGAHPCCFEGRPIEGIALAPLPSHTGEG